MTAKLIKIFTFNKIGMQENDTALPDDRKKCAGGVYSVMLPGTRFGMSCLCLFLIPSRISCLRDIPPQSFLASVSPSPSLVFVVYPGLNIVLKFFLAIPLPVSLTSIHTIFFSVPVVMSSLPSPCMASSTAFLSDSPSPILSAGGDSCTPWSSTEMYADVHSSGYAALHIVERFSTPLRSDNQS